MEVFIVFRSEHVELDRWIDELKAVFTNVDVARAFIDDMMEKEYSDAKATFKSGEYDEEYSEYIVNEALNGIGWFIRKCTLDDPKTEVQFVFS